MADTTATAEPTADATTATADTPTEDKPLGENGEKALKAERERAAKAEKATADLQRQLDAINAANMSELDRAKKEATDAQEAAKQATADALRFRIAAKHSISDDDAELFLTGADEQTLERQAARLIERGPSGPRPDPSQGAKDSKGASSDPATAFAQFMQNATGQ